VPVGGSAGLEVVAGQVEGFTRRELSVPGMTVGLVGPGGWHRELAVGVADVASGRGMDPGPVMPVASVGKG
jgi:hypothetical protein